MLEVIKKITVADELKDEFNTACAASGLNANVELLNLALRTYVEFEIGADGVSLIYIDGVVNLKSAAGCSLMVVSRKIPTRVGIDDTSKEILQSKSGTSCKKCMSLEENVVKSIGGRLSKILQCKMLLEYFTTSNTSHVKYLKPIKHMSSKSMPMIHLQ